VLSLLVVPAVYTYVDDLEEWLARLFRATRTQTGQSTRIATGNNSD